MYAFPWLLALFIAVPVLELYLLILIGSTIGALPTVLLVLGTAVAGVVLLRRQGLATLGRLQAAIQRGQAPAGELVEGALLLLGGACLLTPGFVTDALGILCLIPLTRRLAARRLLASTLRTRPASNPGAPGQVIEGEFTRSRESGRERP